ncbi:MAG: hypothetical protein Q9187_003105 [Circinaria calcarea]
MPGEEEIFGKVVLGEEEMPEREESIDEDEVTAEKGSITESDVAAEKDSVNEEMTAAEEMISVEIIGVEEAYIIEGMTDEEGITGEERVIGEEGVTGEEGITSMEEMADEERITGMEEGTAAEVITSAEDVTDKEEEVEINVPESKTDEVMEVDEDRKIEDPPKLVILEKLSLVETNGDKVDTDGAKIDADLEVMVLKVLNLDDKVELVMLEDEAENPEPLLTPEDGDEEDVTEPRLLVPLPRSEVEGPLVGSSA